MPENKHKDHVNYQTDYFNTNHDFFRGPIPQDVVERTKKIILAAGLDATSRVLDVGTGMGVLIPHLQTVGVKAVNIVGCDLSQNMLAEARRRYAGVSFWQGDFAMLPTDYGQFDAVFFNACFGNLFNPQEAVANAAARLKTGGKIVISHPMGNRFVRQLKESDPKLVLFLLPAKFELTEWSERLNLNLCLFLDEDELYIASLQKQ